MSGSFFITTAIDYTNAAPHVGHAYEKVLADVIARFRRLRGDEVFFLTGVDQHGQKVQQSAEREGVEPQVFVDRMTALFREPWDRLQVGYTEWAATTDPRHKACVGKILTRLNDEGQIYKATRSGFYSVRQEQFLTDKERGPDGEFGPEWGQVEEREEENYYFRLAEHRQWLLDLIDKRSAAGKPLVLPEFRVGELRNAVEKLEGDLCISRPRARLAWGIPFPFDEDFVTYVWFDALVNYLSFAPGYDPAPGADLSEFSRWWPALHVIGKDILIPHHGVYWPIMLKALGFADGDIPPLLAHGWWNIGGAKMSKSLGNSVEPGELAGRYGADALRYYLVRDIATGRDADFSEDRLRERYNADLANDLGNLLNRALNMAQRYRQGIVRVGEPDAACAEVAQLAGEVTQAWAERMERHEVHLALEEIWKLIARCNAFVEESAPWKLAKEEAQAGRLDAVLHHLAESLRIVSILVAPVMPAAAETMRAQLQWQGEPTVTAAAWGGLTEGHALGLPVPLFPRLEV